MNTILIRPHSAKCVRIPKKMLTCYFAINIKPILCNFLQQRKLFHRIIPHMVYRTGCIQNFLFFEYPINMFRKDKLCLRLKVSYLLDPTFKQDEYFLLRLEITHKSKETNEIDLPLCNCDTTMIAHCYEDLKLSIDFKLKFFSF